MSVFKNLALIVAVYAGYQLLTNKKYSDLRKKFSNEYDKVQPSLLNTLDDLHTYLSVPKDVADDTTRIKLDEEINLLKKKIANINSEKFAENANKVTGFVIDTTIASANKVIKKRQK